MEIIPARMPERGERYVGEEPAGALGLELDPQYGEHGPLRYDCFAELIGHELMVRGRVWAEVDAVCSRCGDACVLTIEESDFLACREVPEESVSVDLTPDMREAILLNFPAHPLCRSDCEGVCGGCGVRRTDKACECRLETDLRWRALNGLTIERDRE